MFFCFFFLILILCVSQPPTRRAMSSMSLSVETATASTTPWRVTAWATARTSPMRSSPTAVSRAHAWVFFCLFSSSWAAAVLVIRLTFIIGLFCLFLRSQPTVCARRATGAAWTAAACLTPPGATGRTTARTILMKPSATVSWGFYPSVNSSSGAGVRVFHHPRVPQLSINRRVPAHPTYTTASIITTPLRQTTHCH